MSSVTNVLKDKKQYRVAYYENICYAHSTRQRDHTLQNFSMALIYEQDKRQPLQVVVVLIVLCR